MHLSPLDFLYFGGEKSNTSSKKPFRRLVATGLACKRSLVVPGNRYLVDLVKKAKLEFKYRSRRRREDGRGVDWLERHRDSLIGWQDCGCTQIIRNFLVVGLRSRGCLTVELPKLLLWSIVLGDSASSRWRSIGPQDTDVDTTQVYVPCERSVG